MGRGDRKTRKGKISIRSYGNVRPHATKVTSGVAITGVSSTGVKPLTKVAAKKAPAKKAAAKKTA